MPLENTESLAKAVKNIFVQQEGENSCILHNFIHLKLLLTVYRLCHFIEFLRIAETYDTFLMI